MRCTPGWNLNELTQIIGCRACYGGKPTIRVGYHKKICLPGDSIDIQGLRGNSNPRMFIEIIKCKELDAACVVSGLGNQTAWKVQRTPASFPCALIVDRWTFIWVAGWSVLTLMVAFG